MIEKIIQTIKNSKNIAIYAHIKPDGDSVGSAVGMKILCQKLGVNASLFCEDDIPEKLDVISQWNCFSKECNQEDYDCHIAMDCGDLGRLGIFQQGFLRHKNTINIDHHINSNFKFAKINLLENYAATCEIVFKIAKAAKVEFDKDLSTALYVGISTDTGNFMHNSTNEHTFYCAKELICKVVDTSKICNRLYRENPVERFKLLADVLYNARFFYDNKVVMLIVTKEKLAKYGANISHTEGFVDNAVNVIGAEVGICMTQTKEYVYKISFRSKGNVDVFKIADSFGGGGHKYAAACSYHGDLETVVDKISKEVLFFL